VIKNSTLFEKEGLGEIFGIIKIYEKFLGENPSTKEESQIISPQPYLRFLNLPPS